MSKITKEQAAKAANKIRKYCGHTQGPARANAFSMKKARRPGICANSTTPAIRRAGGSMGGNGNHGESNKKAGSANCLLASVELFSLHLEW